MIYNYTYTEVLPSGLVESRSRVFDLPNTICCPECGKKMLAYSDAREYRGTDCEHVLKARDYVEGKLAEEKAKKTIKKPVDNKEETASL